MKAATTFTIWNDHAAASNAAAHQFVTLCQQAVSGHGRFTVALSGGNTPKELYRLLSTKEFSRNIPWKDVFIYWGDERFVPHTDADSNFRMADETLLKNIPIPAENIFSVPIEKDAKRSAEKYEETILDFFKNKKPVFDCILLGVGNDGHTASLFPGTKILKEKKRLIKEVWVEEKNTWRISFTFPLINQAAAAIFLATGKEKAPILSRITGEKKIKPLLPVQRIRLPKGIVSWILDEAAVAQI